MCANSPQLCQLSRLLAFWALASFAFEPQTLRLKFFADSAGTLAGLAISATVHGYPACPAAIAGAAGLPFCLPCEIRPLAQRAVVETQRSSAHTTDPKLF